MAMGEAPVNLGAKPEEDVMFRIGSSLKSLALTALIGVFAALGAAAPASAGLVWESLASFSDPRFGGAGIEGAAANIIGGKIYVSEHQRERLHFLADFRRNSNYLA